MSRASRKAPEPQFVPDAGATLNYNPFAPGASLPHYEENGAADTVNNQNAREESLRTVSAQSQPEERLSDEELRPNTLDSFVGRPLLKEQLRLFLDASIKREVPPDHILLAGPPGHIVPAAHRPPGCLWCAAPAGAGCGRGAFPVYLGTPAPLPV